jgi:voltage-gated potassium channel
VTDPAGLSSPRPRRRGLFGVLTGFLANFFLAPKRRPLIEPGRAAPTPKVMIAQIRHAIELQEQQQADLRSRLDELEQLL